LFDYFSNRLFVVALIKTLLAALFYLFIYSVFLKQRTLEFCELCSRIIAANLGVLITAWLFIYRWQYNVKSLVKIIEFVYQLQWRYKEWTRLLIGIPRIRSTCLWSARTDAYKMRNRKLRKCEHGNMYNAK